MLMNVLIVFFITLIFYQLVISQFLSKSNYYNIIEGMESKKIKSYNKNDPSNALILAQENAGNIQVIKKQLDKLLDLNKQVETMNSDLEKLSEQVNGLTMK